MNYTVTQHENGHWIASDGIASAAGTDPGDALDRLTEPDICASLDAVEASWAAQHACLRLINALAVNAPEEVVQGFVASVERMTKRYLSIPNN